MPETNNKLKKQYYECKSIRDISKARSTMGSKVWKNYDNGRSCTEAKE
tara:strand:- start:2459 stop:2602 length:144 start_codon:yes stop_codon:yes gene_type:complete